jgi:hypothetical protein
MFYGSVSNSIKFLYIITLIHEVGGTCGTNGGEEGNRPLGRPRRRRIDNIKMDLLEVGLSVVDWIVLAQDRYRWRALVNSVMNLQVP